MDEKNTIAYIFIQQFNATLYQIVKGSIDGI